MPTLLFSGVRVKAQRKSCVPLRHLVFERRCQFSYVFWDGPQLASPTYPGKHLPDSVAVECSVAVGVAVAAVGLHVGVSGSLR